jgi:hypothetical protein
MASLTDSIAVVRNRRMNFWPRRKIIINSERFPHKCKYSVYLSTVRLRIMFAAIIISLLKNINYFTLVSVQWPITAVVRSKAWTIFAHSNNGIVGSIPTWGMDVCVRLFYVCVLCEGSGLVTGWSPFQVVLPTVYRIKKLKNRPRSKGL